MMGLRDHDLREVLKGKLYFSPLRNNEEVKPASFPGPVTCFSVDNELVYEPFFADFGPLNLACTYRFCWKLDGLLKEAEERGHCVCFCCSAEPKKKANAAVLLGAYLVLFEGEDADAAYAHLAPFEPFLPFRDPTCGVSTYPLSVLDCIRAMIKGHHLGWIDFNNFNLEDYEFFEQVENGDLNWIVPGKLVAFSGPAARRAEIYGYRTLVPEDYVDYFERTGVTAVIRLNKRVYDRRRFLEHGLNHYDLYFPDGSCPTDRILQRFLEIVEETPGGIAVHCKAGLGRTGVLIGCYLMKHHRFTANEALGYLRIHRPGSVIGPQQHFLREMQSRMWKAGDAMRLHQEQVNSNSRPIFKPCAEEAPSISETIASSFISPFTSGPAGPAAWGQSKNVTYNNRTYSMNPIIRRMSANRPVDRSNATSLSADWSSAVPKSGSSRTNHGRSSVWEQLPSPVQRVKRATSSSVNNGSCQTAPVPQKEDSIPLNDASIWGSGSGSKSLAILPPGLNGSKDAMRPVPPSRCSVSQRSSRGSLSRGLNIETSVGGLAVSAGPPASSSTLHIRKGRPSSLSAPPVVSIPSRRAYQPTGNGGLVVDSPGMRNASSSNTAAVKARVVDTGGTGLSSGSLATGTGSCGTGAAGGATVGPSSGPGSTNGNVNGTGVPVVQRIINTAGQPRKVIVPAGQDHPSGREGPGRRKSMPTRRPTFRLGQEI